MNKHKSNKIKENSNTVRHLIMGQIITTQNLVATKVVRLAWGLLGQNVWSDTGNTSQYEYWECYARFLLDFPSVWSDTGNGRKLLGIYWEIRRIMQMRCSGTKCLIRHQEYLPGFPSINTGNVMQDSYHVSAFPSACDQTLGILARYKCWKCR